MMKIDKSNPKKKLKDEYVDKVTKFFHTYWKLDHSSIKESHPFLS